MRSLLVSSLSRSSRFLVYGLAGWAVDSLFVLAHTGRRRPSSLLNVPVYGLAQPLFEPLHSRLRHRPVAVRAAVYGVGILGVEYASGRLFRRFLGRVPWSYEGARLNVGGLVRLDYFPLWAAFGLGLERLHDLLAYPMREPRGSLRPFPVVGSPRSRTKREAQGREGFEQPAESLSLLCGGTGGARSAPGGHA